ncbi:hypothetical protein BZG02_19220 [Labilibaculum filiforme]|uniref:Uncharacterized protein n=1 Tax=Labilibaculum filiforme TaxID=1940526 RepID=A0A2N3HR03_9BACT|nr:hypothetical protein BZG02_19220 [Labilibaculum filiforme]
MAIYLIDDTFLVSEKIDRVFSCFYYYDALVWNYPIYFFSLLLFYPTGIFFSKLRCSIFI